MASSALEAKINKIRQQNEEIRRRYEEVEEDKKNAAKLNALVQMVPSTDWPERKEPPEFSNPPRPKQKVPKEKPDHVVQPHVAEGKKVHTFAQGEGPPPDPKYNFLADSEREEISTEHSRENVGSKPHAKITRGNFRKKGPGRETIQKDNKIYKGNPRDEYQPGYDAWRAERNRIDEDRISRQRTAEGNWRREWDNDKMHIVDDTVKAGTRPALGDFVKKDHKDYERKYNVNGSDHMNQSRGGYRPYRGNSKNFYNNYDNRPYNNYEQHKHNSPMSAKAPLSPTTSEGRTVVATDKSLKVTLNQGNAVKGQVMSVKVNSPSIAGTGRVGPRQRTRVTYSHTDAEMAAAEMESFSRQKSFDEKSKAAYFNNQKFSDVRRTHSLKKPGSKSPYLPRKDMQRDENTISGQRYHENEFRSHSQRDNRDFQKPYFNPKSPRATKTNAKLSKQDSNAAGLETVENTEAGVEKSENKDEENTEMQHVDVPKVEESNKPESSETLLENSKSTLSETEEPMEECKSPSVNNETEAEETVQKEETVDTSASQCDATTMENVTKDDANDQIICDEQSSHSIETMSSPSENPDDKSNLSLGKSVEEARSQDVEEIPINESNIIVDDKLSGDTLINTEPPSNSSEEDIKPSSNNCDTVKDKVTDEKQESVDPVESSATETCSVIEATDRSIAIDQAANPDPAAESNVVELRNVDEEANPLPRAVDSTNDDRGEKNSEVVTGEGSSDNLERTLESQSEDAASTREDIAENSEGAKE